MIVVSRAYVAIAILRYLAARQNLVVSSTELTRVTSVPRPYLRKVANQLIQAGMIRSVRGSTGGFALDCPPSAIRLGDVLNVIEGTRVTRGMPRPDPALSAILDKARLKFIEVLNEHSITDLCAPRPHRNENWTQRGDVPAEISA